MVLAVRKRSLFYIITAVSLVTGSCLLPVLIHFKVCEIKAEQWRSWDDITKEYSAASILVFSSHKGREGGGGCAAPIRASVRTTSKVVFYIMN